MARPVGIDLGTTCSAVACVDSLGAPRTIEAEEGRPHLASAVHYGPDGEIEVGAAARRRAPERPGDTVVSPKRLLGRAVSDLGPEERALLRLSGDGPVPRIAVGRGRRPRSPVEVAAEILRALRGLAARELGGAPGTCAIAVPAWADDARRRATLDAARLAGLEGVHLLNEPTAAALAYGLEKGSRGTYAVYALGGGGFEVSILRLGEGLIEVLAAAGDPRLGGEDMDRALARWMLERSGVPAAPSPGALRGALEAARELREGLTFREEVQAEVDLPGGRRLRHRIRRSDLEGIIGPLVERTAAPCLQALRDAGLEAHSVDGVVLVGGATRTPMVRRHVRKLFAQLPFTDVDPDAAVALGAAIHADALDRGGREDLVLREVSSHSLGVERRGGAVERIIPRNSPLPATAARELTTWADGQTGLVLHLVQGERDLAADCRTLARLDVEGIPPLPAGAGRLEVAYSIDVDGIAQVGVRELSTGARQRVRMQPGPNLPREELERLLAEALPRADEDQRRRLLAEWRSEAEGLRAALSDARSGGAPGSAERAAAERAVAGLRQASAGEDGLALRASIEAAEASLQALAGARAERCVIRALAARRSDEGAPSLSGAAGPAE